MELRHLLGRHPMLDEAKEAESVCSRFVWANRQVYDAQRALDDLIGTG